MSKTITISGQNFEISTPYVEGGVLTAIEAKVLNQTRAENIGNNFRKQVAAAAEKGDLSEVTAEIAEYDAGYTFSAGGQPRTPIDPIEAEAIRIAKTVVAAKIKEKYSCTIKAYVAADAGNQAKYDAAVEKTAQQDDTLKLAKKAVADKKKVMEVASEDLGI